MKAERIPLKLMMKITIDHNLYLIWIAKFLMESFIDPLDKNNPAIHMKSFFIFT